MLKSLIRSRATKLIYIFAAICIVTVGIFNYSRACGPHNWPSTDAFTDHNVMKIPSGNIFYELKPLAAKFKGKLKFDESHPPYRTDYSKQTARADSTDIHKALNLSRMPAADKINIVKSIDTNRKKITEFRKDVEAWVWNNARLPQEKREAKPKAPQLIFHKSVPKEFKYYLQGALAYHADDHKTARKHWAKILALPGIHRRFRSTWASYMLGKTYMKDNSQKAREYFAQTHQLKLQGFEDTLELAIDSLGESARVDMSEKKYASAIKLYLQQFATGEYRGANSVKFACSRILGQTTPDELAKHINDETLAEALAILISTRLYEYDFSFNRSRKAYIDKYLEAAKIAKLKQIPQADRLCWAAYSVGEFDTAKKLLSKANADKPIIKWVKSKFLLKEGKTQQAADLMIDILEAHRKSELSKTDKSALLPKGKALENLLASQIGGIKLGQGQYTEAINVFASEQHWVAAAYIAERILTVDELIKYVDANWPKPKLPSEQIEEGKGTRADDFAYKIRFLLARRLFREEKYDTARNYYPKKMPEHLDEYLALLKEGRDTSKSKIERGRKLWKAAMTLRHCGMSLCGTELDPDDSVCHGGYNPSFSYIAKRKSKFIPLRKDELTRFKASKPSVDKRFHYRWLAADIAWEASKLMPDNTDETAEMLWRAGRWIMYAEPKAADKFYKSLVNRCRKTKLGQAADKLRWFPKKLPGEKETDEEPKG